MVPISIYYTLIDLQDFAGTKKLGIVLFLQIPLFPKQFLVNYISICHAEQQKSFLIKSNYSKNVIFVVSNCFEFHFFRYLATLGN